ncbi:MAG: DNA mismatch repair protein MutS [Rhodothermales bacterium]|jgi:DNA mismatch repair protein MutS
MAKDPKLTPMMRQYRSVKADLAEDVLLLFRMGDFYEMFFEDATRGAEIMEITLTKRQGIPMAGVPYHALENYLQRILLAGVKVAIAEQVEDPKQAKGLVRREVTQVITPGTIVEGGVLSAQKSNFLLSICRGTKGRFGLAGLDISTGDFRLTEVAGMEALETEIHRLQPAECLLPENLDKEWKAEGRPDVPTSIVWTPVDEWTYDDEVARDFLHRHFQVASLDGFGCREFSTAVGAAGAVLYYAQTNLRRDAKHITRLTPYAANRYMVVDRVSQRNLELVEPLFTDSRDATLLSVLNRAATPMGNRMIREWILRPLLDKTEIDARLDAVQVFFQDQLLLLELREALRAVRDLERTIARLNVGSANARDLLVLQRGFDAMPGLKAIVAIHSDSSLLNDIQARLAELPEIVDLISTAIADEPPNTVKDGGIIRDGYVAQLDEFRSAATEGKSWLADLQTREQERTGIKNLKVRYNKVFGYYIEISKSQLLNAPDDYTRKQTLVNAERFITPELKEIESKVLGAEDKSKALEYEIFQDIRLKVIANTAIVQTTAHAIGELDAISALAESAQKNHYVRPTITDDYTLDIRDGRHPVIDHLMTDARFVPNDSQLNGQDRQLIILTGPNMAGKSTYIRQVALITLLAQMGSFVPARSATIGIADRIFTRIGAADDLSRGQSTFMVEMLETANILNNATARSLIILDEIGRGTSTFDGLSIAWAVAEFLHNTPASRARTLFATHYHELTQLATTLPGVVNCNVAVHESGDTVVFTHKIQAGAANKSYGIHVAQLAGLPSPVLQRARDVLANLEGESTDTANRPKIAKQRKAPPPSAHPSLFDF